MPNDITLSEDLHGPGMNTESQKCAKVQLPGQGAGGGGGRCVALGAADFDTMDIRTVSSRQAGCHGQSRDHFYQLIMSHVPSFP